MAAHWVAIVLGIFAAILVLSAFTAQGTPAAPTAVLSGTLNPSLSQNYQLTLSTQVYSITPPNSIYMLGGNFVYSIAQPDGKGGTIVLAQAQHAPLTVANQSGFVYTVQATVSFTTTAICGSAGCQGSVMDLTVTAYAIVNTYWGSFLSPTAYIQFSTNSAYQSIPAQGSPPVDDFLLELIGPLAGAGMLGTAAAGVIGPKQWFIGTGLSALALAVLVLLVWLFPR